MSDRHEKWVKVEPGTVIPAGQPYRVEWTTGRDEKEHAEENPGSEVNWKPSRLRENQRWFVDSSWRPPLDLPTEPMWGIAVNVNGYAVGQEWCVNGPRLTSSDNYCWDVAKVLDFIPLTDEQVKRIKAAR